MKNRLMLVYPFFKDKADSYYPPLGLAALISYIRSKNKQQNIRAHDFTVEHFSTEQFSKELEDFKPEIVGISVWSLSYASSRLIARITRDLSPQSTIVMGGVHATMRPEECLECCDIVVRGEGEQTLWEIIQGREIYAIKGISFWKNGEIIHNEKREMLADLDMLPFPDYTLFPNSAYHDSRHWGVMGSRGCPYKCTFCLSPKTWGSVVRFRSVNNIIDEIELLHHEYDVETVSLHDDTINIPRQRAIDIGNEIIKRNLHKKINFECQMRANRQFVSPEVFQKLNEANFTTVYFGIESGSDNILRLINKSLTSHEANQAVKMAREAGIKRVGGFFMVGQWGETISDVIKTWRFILTSKVEVYCGVCIPFPGTDFYQLLLQNQLIKKEPEWGNFNLFIPQVRTNKMSRATIFAMLILTNVEIFVLNLVIRHKLIPAHVTFLRLLLKKLIGRGENETGQT